MCSAPMRARPGDIILRRSIGRTVRSFGPLSLSLTGPPRVYCHARLQDRPNPFHSVSFDKCAVDTYSLTKTFKGHMASVAK